MAGALRRRLPGLIFGLEPSNPEVLRDFIQSLQANSLKQVTTALQIFPNSSAHKRVVLDIL